MKFLLVLVACLLCASCRDKKELGYKLSSDLVIAVSVSLDEDVSTQVGEKGGPSTGHSSLEEPWGSAKLSIVGQEFTPSSKMGSVMVTSGSKVKTLNSSSHISLKGVSSEPLFITIGVGGFPNEEGEQVWIIKKAKVEPSEFDVQWNVLEGLKQSAVIPHLVEDKLILKK